MAKALEKSTDTFPGKLQGVGYLEVARQTYCHDVSLVPSGHPKPRQRLIADALKEGKMFDGQVSPLQIVVGRYRRSFDRWRHTDRAPLERIVILCPNGWLAEQRRIWIDQLNTLGVPEVTYCCAGAKAPGMIKTFSPCSLRLYSFSLDCPE